jgi:methylmalonyl-CoA/ethylmalonyl-CoA epimerase
VIAGIDHVGIVVEEIDAALRRYQQTFGMSLRHREVLAEHGVEAAMLAGGDGQIELLAPLSPDSATGRFLQARGPGLHHVAYRVEDIDTALEELRAAEVELIDAEPRSGMLARRIAFVHPSSTGGVLTELVEVGES